MILGRLDCHFDVLVQCIRLLGTSGNLHAQDNLVQLMFKGREQVVSILPAFCDPPFLSGTARARQKDAASFRSAGRAGGFQRMFR